MERSGIFWGYDVLQNILIRDFFGGIRLLATSRKNGQMDFHEFFSVGRISHNE